jgi:mRNA interferase MazF
VSDLAADLRRGAVVWAAPDPAVGREQTGRRPAVVISSDAYLRVVTELVVVLPVTSVDRGWPNHVPLGGPDVGLDVASFAMTEQPRSIDRARINALVGAVDHVTLAAIDRYLREFLGLRAS